MNIGIPREIKDQEFRVGLTPGSVRTLCEQGHQVHVETQAGAGAGYSDADYQTAGATIASTAAHAWQQKLIVKVKEPLVAEYGFLRPDQMLFTYLHLAANRELTEQLIASGVTAIAYESVEDRQDGHVHHPLLAPMSVIAGRLSVQIGAHYLQRQHGGRGILLSGIPGVKQGNVVILGGGVVGAEAARIAIGMGARVTILDVNVSRLAELEILFGCGAALLCSNAQNIRDSIIDADLVVGAVLIPGKRAPILVSRELVSKMRAGSVIVDVAVDQGGCIETMRVTSHTNPVFHEHGVLHYGVPNMPGAVPWTSTQALNNSTFPFVLELAAHGIKALDSDAALAAGLAVSMRRLVHPAVREVFPDLAS